MDLKERAAEEGIAVEGFCKWSDIRSEYVDGAGGEERVAAGKRRLMARQHGHQLAEIRRNHGLTQSDLASIMGVTKGRVSHIENGEGFTVEVLARYVQALDGELDLVAHFGDHTYKMGGGVEEIRATG